MITVGEHQQRVLTSTPLLKSEVVPLASAQGRCLADQVVTRIPVPPWTNSAMDGYAVRSEDLDGAEASNPVSLEVVADLPAGSSAEPLVGCGQAARIMTGAAVPPGADTVVPQELTDQGEQVVLIKESLPLGRHVRVAGEDRQIGDRILEAGSTLTPEGIAGIASAGVGEVTVSRQPKVVVISTGDELVPPGNELVRGQIPDSNGLLISMLASEAGAQASVDHAGDGPGQLAAAIERHRDQVDLVVITGGVSVGAFDPVKALFEEGDAVRFDRVSMQPGKPQAFGKLPEDGPLIFGLPGNPVSAWVSFQMFVRPALRKMQGCSSLLPEPVPAIAGVDWATPKGRQQVIPVRIFDGQERRVFPAAEGGSGSHLIASLAAAEGFALVEADVEKVRAGEAIPSVRLRNPENFNHQQRSNP